jgi:hypothetical protein
MNIKTHISVNKGGYVMKKAVITIILSFGCFLFLFACGVRNTEKEEIPTETITVETQETTTVPVITVGNIVTTTKSIQTTAQLKKLNLNNKLKGPYSYESIEFSAPEYLNKKAETDKVFELSKDGVGFIHWGNIECNEVQYELLKSDGNLEELNNKLFSGEDKYSELAKINTKNVYSEYASYQYWLYKCKYNGKELNLYITWVFDTNSEKLYLLTFAFNNFDYDFESDFVSIIKSIKIVEYSPEKNDILQINKSFLSKDWGGDTVLVVEYTWKNTTDETTSFSWNVSTKCFQNGVECKTSYLCDDVESGDASKEVMPGYSITVRKAYEIKDMSDVTIQCSKFLSSTPFLETTIKLS